MPVNDFNAEGRVKRVYCSGSWKTFSYDARDNMTQGDGLTSTSYNAIDKPTQIKKDGKTLNFTYGPQYMRFKQVNGSVTTYYSDKLYEEEINGTKTTWRAYIDYIAVISQTTGECATIRYTHRDRLGSARVFTDHNGQVEAERNFDPFGKPRLASGGLKSFGNSKLDDLDKAKTRRGFTDHEHLDNVELIHMNGRVYDYNLGRFMSVDPVIQSPTNSQSINPYSYIMNNPLSGTDPTGYRSCDADNPENCQEVAEELGKDKKADITQRQSVTGSRIKRDVKVGMMTGNGNGTVNIQIGNMSATADIGAPASNNKGANSTNVKNAFGDNELNNVINPVDPDYQSKLDGMNSLFYVGDKGPGSEFDSEDEIVSLLDEVVHPYAAGIKMEIGTNIYGTKNGKLTFAPLVLADKGTPLQVDTEKSISGIRIAPARVTADWHSHAMAAQEMSGGDVGLAISLNRTSYVSSKYGISRC